MLFDEESEAEEEGFGTKLEVNKNYAARFEKRKKAQELARLRERHRGDEDDEDMSSEDENAELLTPALDVQIFNTMHKIANREPEIYKPDAQFFDEEGEEGDGEEEEATGGGDADGAAARRKPLTVKQQLLDQGATGLVSDDEDEEEGERRSARAKTFAYDAEQRELRKAFLAEAGGGEEDEGEDEVEAGGQSGAGVGGMLRRKAVTAAERASEQREYSEWLREALDKEANKGAVDDSVTLRRYMFGAQLTEDERFLRDYVLNAMWKNPGAAQGHGADGDALEDEGARGAKGVVAAAAGEEEDEDEFSDRADDYERRHNFRFEEEGANAVVSHPRHDPSSVRRQAALGRKKEAEDAKRARRAEAKAQKEAELKRLKNLKKQEILERLRSIEHVSGGVSALSEVDLSGDFDPDAWDQRMAELFDDSYYSTRDEGFRAAEEELDDADYVNQQLGDGWRGWEGGDAGGDGGADDWQEGEWGGGDGGTSKSGRKASGGGKAASGSGGFEQLTARLRGSGESSAKKTAQQYMDEYYALDYEDLIGGDLPTRFRYRPVQPAGFGITDGELLNEDERSLAKRVPLRFVKRPYAKTDETQLKGRANRVRWEERRDERNAKRSEAAKAKAKGAAIAAKAASKAARLQPTSLPPDGPSGGGEGERMTHGGGTSGAKRKGDAATSGERHGGKRRKADVEAPPPPTDAKAAAKAARLAKRGVTEQRLGTFAKLAQAGKARSKADKAKHLNNGAKKNAPMWDAAGVLPSEL